MSQSLLVVDDERHTREGLEAAFEDDFDVYLAASAEEAFNLLDAQPFDAVITDLRLPGGTGMKVIDRALKAQGRPVTIMMTAYGSVDSAVEAMKRGATDFVTKPLNLQKLEILLQRALKARQTQSENTELHQRLDKKFSFEGIIGSSQAIERVLDTVKLVAPSRASVLIEGETGTGKELVAQAIHQNSDRARGPFVAVHAQALPANLLESELFGHEKGAFTGATERRVGRFEAADGGTLFLDEIGEIDASTQVKLLRFLESRQIERLGSMKPIPLDIRLVAATNRDLEAMVQAGDFRDDLFYRLNVVRIEMPALRERRDDIPLLLDHFLRQFAQENGYEPPRISPEALRRLHDYSWPGNIRELRNFAENAVVLSRGGSLSEYDLDGRFLRDQGPDGAPGAGSPTLSVEENEKRLLRNALVEAKGNRSRAAELMGISRRTLHRKLAQWPELDYRSHAR